MMSSNCSTSGETAQRRQRDLRLLARPSRAVGRSRRWRRGCSARESAATTSLDVSAAQAKLVRIDPDPHAVIALAEQKDVADPVHARQFVLDLQDGVIAEIELVVAADWRD